jgi:hypothetical protein
MWLPYAFIFLYDNAMKLGGIERWTKSNQLVYQQVDGFEWFPFTTWSSK